MHAAIWGAIRKAPRPTRCAFMFIGKCRYPPAASCRIFHRSTISCTVPENPIPGNSDAQPDDAIIEVEKKEAGNRGADESTPSEPDYQALARRLRDGNGTRRTKSRQKDLKGLPPFLIPEWFFRNNVHLGGGMGSVDIIGQAPAEKKPEAVIDAPTNENVPVESESIDYSTKVTGNYILNYNVYTEIIATLRAGLDLRPPKNTGTQNLVKPGIILQCPRDGGSVYLDHIVSTASSELGADLVQLDAQDIAQIIGPYLDENLAWNSVRTAMYGYEAQAAAGKTEQYRATENESHEIEEAGQGEGEMTGSVPSAIDFSAHPRTLSSVLAKFLVTAPKRALISSNISRNCRPMKSPSNVVLTFPPVSALGISADSRDKDISSPEPWQDHKVSAALKALVEAADSKRAGNAAPEFIESAQLTEQIEPESRETKSSGTANTDELKEPLKPLIIQVKDYEELRSVDRGSELLQRLRLIVSKKWQEGRRITLVGTTEGDPLLSKPGIQLLQEEMFEGEKQTILVPTNRAKEQDLRFAADEKARVRHINIRHIEDMILKLSEGNDISLAIDLEKGLDSATVFSSGLEDFVWTYSRVFRVATTILGLPGQLQSQNSESTVIDGTILSRTLTILSNSDEAKFAWGAEVMNESEKELNEDKKPPFSDAAKKASEKASLMKKCNGYESKLLSGVVSPDRIHATFADIHVPKDAVEALRTLTSLSLARPDAFTYGVLRTDKIPGILLYGPPGTGKTLLAKAVAKESGATVLEVSAADLNNMYVGEGEKNVQAVFTLAKKLSPCVIFIDEADSIFGSRESSRQRSHREMINQFLREWDGMDNFSGLIMVATNRPYDLDDAVLRRLPRRLLVDLPIEKDREEILKIHLKEENMDKSICLAALAKDTPYYSGSDLKNLSVAAALACVREENDIAANHTGNEPYVHAERRTLHKRHFDKAIGEISASINEDMSSLMAIKKFDEKYGDRKGRRKAPVLGFGGSILPDKDPDTARVRPMATIDVGF